MNTQNIDTLQMYDKLTAVGFTDQQARALIDLHLITARILLESMRKKRYNLDELMDGMTPEEVMAELNKEIEQNIGDNK